jgi:sulfide:quinone oxidoreductase
MSTDSAFASPTRRPRVIVAGGGVAALEAVLTLEEIAGEELDVVLLTAKRRFRYVPLSVAEAFRAGHAYRLDLADMLEPRGVEVVVGALDAVDVDRRRLRIADGRTLGYDALLVAVGTERRGALRGALTFAGWQAPTELRRLLRQATAGQLRRLVFAAPSGVAWTLPAYELALMAAARFADDMVPTEVALVTPEPRPVDAFGDGPSRAVTEALRARRVAFHSATPLRVMPGRLVVRRHAAIAADAVVALPVPVAIEIAGLPGDDAGFLPIDEHCRVRGATGVYAAGDATSFPYKQGGIAAQQAGAAAEAIAADLGCDIAPKPFRPELRGLLLTGSPPRYRRVDAGPARAGGEANGAEPWWPHAKVAGRRVAPFLAAHGVPFGAPPSTVALDLEAERGRMTTALQTHDNQGRTR